MKSAILGFAGLLLTAQSSLAATNTQLFTCESPDATLAPYLYNKAQLSKVEDRVAKVRLTIGQDTSNVKPIFEVKLDLLDGAGSPIRTSKNVQRIAYVESPDSGRVVITYSPNRSLGAQGSKAFSMLIDEDGTGKLSFIQIGARNAPNDPTELTCTRVTKGVSVPQTIDLAKLDDAQKLKVLRTLQRTLPTNTVYRSDNQDIAPTGVDSAVLAKLAEKLENLDFTEDDFRKRGSLIFTDPTVTIEPKGNRCGALKWRHFKPVRDLTGNTIAYSGGVICEKKAVSVSGTNYRGETVTKDHMLEYTAFFVFGSELLVTEKTDYDFQMNQ